MKNVALMMLFVKTFLHATTCGVQTATVPTISNANPKSYTTSRLPSTNISFLLVMHISLVLPRPVFYHDKDQIRFGERCSMVGTFVKLRAQKWLRGLEKDRGRVTSFLPRELGKGP